MMSIDERAIGDAPDFSAIQDEDTKEAIKRLTSKVNSLSVADREAALYDLHGIAGIDEKSDKEEQQIVHEMKSVLSQRQNCGAAEAFRAADAASPAYARDYKFLLMFLRCENYNIGAAVLRLFAFFKQKLRLFGPEKLTKEITFDDLSSDDKKCYTAGYFQLLPHRDHAGRAQLISMPQFTTWKTRENMLRMTFHLCMTTLIDEETQKKGAVNIVYTLYNENFTPDPKSRDPILAWDCTQLMQKTLPIRFAGQHFCTNPSLLIGKFFASMARFIGRTGIVRMRFHHGSFDEIQEQIASFGINHIHLAVSKSGDKRTEKQKEYIKMCGVMERARIATPEKVVVVVPSLTDVLLGRGKPTQIHPGNVRLGLIVESLLKRYDGAKDRHEKTRLAEAIVADMKEAGVRFLTRENGYWEEASDLLARDRVTSAFRTARDRSKLDTRNVVTPLGVRKRSFTNIAEAS